MHPLRYCTQTGVDESTDIGQLVELGRRYPFAEFGVLFSASRGAAAGRYPRREWIERLVTSPEFPQMNCALHVCGDAVRKLVDGADAALSEMAEQFGRVQLNLPGSAFSFADIDRVATRVGRSERRTRVIIQHNQATANLCRELRHVHGVEFLFDSSGGRGQVPGTWPRATAIGEFARVGYAGGLGPDNVLSELGRIVLAANDGRAVNDRPYWIDMESGVRDAADRFDLKRAEDALGAVGVFVDERMRLAGRQWGVGRQAVEDLDDFWMQWWAGAAMGYRMVMPPPDPCAPVFFERSTGTYHQLRLTAASPAVEAAVEEFGIASRPVQDRWEASMASLSRGAVSASASTRSRAVLEVLVRDAFGENVALNPTEEPSIMAPWTGVAACGATFSPGPW